MTQRDDSTERLRPKREPDPSEARPTAGSDVRPPVSSPAPAASGASAPSSSSPPPLEPAKLAKGPVTGTLKPPSGATKLPVLEGDTKLTASGPRYAILGSIHRGGMGEILLAKVEGAEGFVRKLVLKGLLSRLSEDDVSYQLFMREACVMACLDHPNVVRVFDLPYVGGKPYLAMEYLRGRNFHQVIQRSGAEGGMPVRVALHVVAEALRGLHYAHNAKDDKGKLLGVIHRDVSPGNILVSFFGEVKVTDFGIAKINDAPRFTGPRSIRGKARYVAPEQVHGDQATIQSDIYSAGVVLAEALLGEPLWERATVPETLLAIVSEDREVTIDRVLKRRPGVPALRAALRGGLALDPRDRFASALQFAETLEAIARTLGGVASHVELGLYVRKLFADAPDLPADDGFGATGLPVPDFGGDELVKTDPTVIALEPEWVKPAKDETFEERPAALPFQMERPLTPHVTPMLESEAIVPLPLDTLRPTSKSRAPSQSRAPSKSRATSQSRAPSKSRGAGAVPGEGAFEVRPPTSIRATPLPADIAVVDPSFLPGPSPSQLEEYSHPFSELIPGLPTDEEPSRDLGAEIDRELALSPRGTSRPESAPSATLVRTAAGVRVLLAGIFSGASLALVGCLLALLLTK